LILTGFSPDEIVPTVRRIAASARRQGGRAFLVGGWVRDRARGVTVKDLDVEVFGLSLDALERLLAAEGEVIAVGRAFGVLRIKGLDVDFSVPRRDSKVGRGHRGFIAEPDAALTPADAARRRDLTVNALLLDPLTGELIDSFGGLADLAARRLRAVDSATFPEDPLRPLRVAQFAARLEFTVDSDLLRICRGIDLAELPRERIWEEWSKLLRLGSRPSLGLRFLREAELLGATPELAALPGVEQDPEWHPEGDVWVHTLLAVDRAAALRTGDPRWDLPLMLGVLCHDLGKALTTRFQDGRWRSHGHDLAGVDPARELLARIGTPAWAVSPVLALVRSHLQPTAFVLQGAGMRAYRRLARNLDAAGVSLRLLERVACADSRGRLGPDQSPGPFMDGEDFLRRAQEYQVDEAARPDAVHGRDLLARGFVPGPEIGRWLAHCREVQDETGWEEPDQVLDEVFRRWPRI
jgi:tRNA nucleotidyltransferase (CCA-adding enzyme)